MTKVAIWCRHQDDNIIGIGEGIPWNVPSDAQKFVRMATGQNVVVGRKTYETLPGRTLPEARIFVLTSNPDYEVSDAQRHQVISSLKMFKDFEEDLYIAGGAKVYEQFFTTQPKLLPEIVVDCVYCGELNPQSKGEVADITVCIDVMKEKYIRVTPEYEKDNVTTTIYIRRGEFIDQAVLKRLLSEIGV